MGRISSSIGLITGVPIVQTVDQLIALQARPRDLLVAKNDEFQQQVLSLTSITALLVSLDLKITALGQSSLFDQRSGTSSDPDALSVSISGQPPLGSYQFTPQRLVQSHQLLSSSFGATDAPVGAGSLSFRFGGFIDDALGLDLINGGQGFQRGRINITDRSGNTAQIDLRLARTVDDVLAAINDNEFVNVRAEARGDSFVLIDTSGGSLDLKIREVGGGSTAASLGFGNLDVAADEIQGADVLRLFDPLQLDSLNDGNGVRLDQFLPDLNVTFRDGTDLDVDFRKLAVAGTKAVATTTAANGPNAQLVFNPVDPGSEYVGVTVVFENDDAITAGEETVALDESDPQNRRLVFKIDEGQTNATHILTALAENEELSAVFEANVSPGSSGLGLISVTDTAVFGAPRATATTPNANADAQITFTAVQGGAEFDDVRIVFEDSVSAGNETVVYDDSDPLDKTLTFQIEAGVTTAQAVIDLLNNDPVASLVFTAASAGDGTGVVADTDGTITSGGALIDPVPAGNEQTLGDILDEINAAGAGRLLAEIDGDRIKLTDLTAGGGTFSVTSLNESRIVEDLGIDTVAAGGVITGRRVLSGLKSSLVSSLSGGNLGTLGSITITDRSGAAANVDLSAAETVDDILAAINNAGIGVKASINDARNGIQLEDTTGLTSSNFIVDNLDATNTADLLQITTDAAVTTTGSGDLHRQTVSEQTLLSTLNGGRGVAKGTFTIFDTNGASGVVNLSSPDIETVGDVLLEISRSGLAIEARINDTGDGIVLIDTADGSEPLTVSEGASSTAADLRLLGSAEKIGVVFDAQGNPTVERFAIDGSSTYVLDFDADDTLDEVVQRIEDLGAGVTASIFNNGAIVAPYRLLLNSQQPGKAGELLIDTSNASFTFTQTVRAQDALLVLGGQNDLGGGVLASSNTNTFNDILPGADLTINKATGESVTISIGRDDAKVADAVQEFVDGFNELRAKIDEVTAFNVDTGEGAVLFGSSSVLRVEIDLANVLTQRFFGVGSIQSLETIGVSLEGDGQLSFDRAKFDAQLISDPASVEQFLTAEQFGVADRLEAIVDQLANTDNALLINRLDSLSQTIQNNEERIAFLNDRLEASRQILLNRFYRMELIIGQLQSSLSAIESLNPIPPLGAGAFN